MSSTWLICAVCAWGATCQKKFTVSGKDMRYVEFVRDITIKQEPEESIEEKRNGKKGKVNKKLLIPCEIKQKVKILFSSRPGQV